MQGTQLKFERSVDAGLTADVAAAQQGDTGAYARLVDAYRNVVCSISLAIVRDVDASEDVAQNVFTAAWHSLHKLRNPQSFAPWLRQLTRNQARHLARTWRRAQRRFALSSDEVLSRAPDPNSLVSDRMVDDEERRRLIEAIDALPDDAREIVTLFYREGRSVAQVARLLDLGENAVKKRLERARTRLRVALLDEVGAILSRTAPTAAFTLAVSAALAVAAPISAQAAAAAVAGSAGWTLKGALSKLGSSLASALPAVLVGAVSTGIWFVKPFRDAHPGPERREVGRIALIAIAHSVLFQLVYACLDIFPSPSSRAAVLVVSWIVLVTSAFVLAYRPFLRTQYFRRRAVAAQGDPIARKRLKNERRFWIAAMATGTTIGAVVLVGMVYRMLVDSGV
jgi:RNA polymerase sigma factor (sigma-70 family)